MSDAALPTRVLVELSGARLGYPDHVLLEGVDLMVREGDFLAIVGPNGAGKTTVLRTILGVLPPLGGSVVARGRLGYSPQRSVLDPIWPFTSSEVVSMGLLAGHGPGGTDLDPQSIEGRACVARALAACGMEAHAGTPFRDLSGGQKQRVLVARALVSGPDVLILDEPTNDLDLRGEHEVMELVSSLHAAGRTVIMVSHMLHVVARHARRMAFIRDGRLTSGDTLDMLTPPRLEPLYGIPVVTGELAGHRTVAPAAHVRRHAPGAALTTTSADAKAPDPRAETQALPAKAADDGDGDDVDEPAGGDDGKRGKRDRKAEARARREAARIASAEAREASARLAAAASAPADAIAPAAAPAAPAVPALMLPPRREAGDDDGLSPLWQAAAIVLALVLTAALWRLHNAGALEDTLRATLVQRGADLGQVRAELTAVTDGLRGALERERVAAESLDRVGLEHSRLEQRAAGQERKLADLGLVLEAARAQARQSEADRAELAAQVASVASERALLRDALALASDDLAGSRLRAEGLRGELDQAKARGEDLVTQRARLEAQLGEASRRESGATAARDVALERLATSERARADVERRLEEQQAGALAAATRLARLEREHALQRDLLAAAMRDLAASGQALETARRRVTELEAGARPARRPLTVGESPRPGVTPLEGADVALLEAAARGDALVLVVVRRPGGANEGELHLGVGADGSAILAGERDGDRVRFVIPRIVAPSWRGQLGLEGAAPATPFTLWVQDGPVESAEVIVAPQDPEVARWVESLLARPDEPRRGF